MPAIKLLLIALIVLLLAWVLRHRRRVGIKASVRITAILLAGLATASVAEPSITTAVASFVGVSRGTDLVLYLLVIAFAFTSSSLYFRFRELELRQATLVRRVAILEALARPSWPSDAEPLTEKAYDPAFNEGAARLS